jgi:hypothetical protein
MTKAARLEPAIAAGLSIYSAGRGPVDNGLMRGLDRQRGNGDARRGRALVRC